MLAERFDRIHPSNLIGMGVLPLRYAAGESAATLGLTGRERDDIAGVDVSQLPAAVTVCADGREFQPAFASTREMELDHYHHGGILPFVLRSLAT